MLCRWPCGTPKQRFHKLWHAHITFIPPCMLQLDLEDAIVQEYFAQGGA
jgi:hypothetical protein